MGDTVFVRIYGSDKWEERKNTVLMQFTGLRDKNGREIYEGDLWRAIGGETPAEVRWNKNGWWFYRRDNPFRPCEWTEDGEVIGNIHENGDLL
jgi:hypothetical protein